MNVEKYLVILNKEDRTAEILKYSFNKYMVEITFKNNNKQYSYSKKSFEFYKDPKVIDITNCRVIILGAPVYNLVKLIKFNEYYKLFFKDNTTRVVIGFKISIIKDNVLDSKCTDKFKYFKDISEVISIKTEEGVSLLTNEYKKINYIDENSALYKYLNSNKTIKQSYEATIIYPFGANKSQFEAVIKAMENQISIIEGPPGTGKIQTILNIIANIVKNNKTVAVVSNNNSATSNIYEKLEKYGLEYLCAQLGRKENKDDFIKNQTGKYPKFENRLQNREKIEDEIKRLNKDVINIFTLKNSIAKLKEELNQIKIEYKYFEKQECLRDMPKIGNIKRVTANIIMLLKVECEELEATNGKIGFWFKFKSRYIYGIGDRKFYNKSLKELIKYYNKLYFIVRQIDINNQIQTCYRELKMLGNENKLNILIENSIKVFKDFLTQKYNRATERRIFTKEELINDSKTFINEYPIILSTTHSIKNCLGQGYKFDYIIMDEASQIDLVTGALALSSAKNAVVVGDLKQLPNIVTSQDKNILEEISKNYEIEMSYNYLCNSFLSSLINSIKDVPRTLLKEHYRCHPRIIDFCNKKFYNNQLIIMTEDNGEEDVLKAYVTAEGNHARGHINQRQIDVIKEEVMPEILKNVNMKDIGIISPYRDQKNNLEKLMDEDVSIDTVHKFQGREQDAIIITTVDNEITEFVDNPNMLNVAVSRAKKYLRVVVSGNKENEGTNIDDLIKYIQYNNCEVVKSKIKSIYDLLYKQNREKRMQYLKNRKRISEYDSENLTYNFIEDIIKKNNYNNLDIAVHIPLADLLENLDKLKDNEKVYANNVWTHVDFAIFNKMDKKMVIAIEVDGYFYHKEGTKQQERDRLKEEILKKYDIPLIRLKTIGKDEESTINEQIKKVFT
ncbi:MAG: AAA domain-containing protein [Clostridia bacterium]|nr:AAA domain-containing protein [Clostridia bacterium]